MVCSCGHGPDDSCWHVPFGLWVYGHGMTRLGHNLHTGILPFQASEYPAEELDFEVFAIAQWVLFAAALSSVKTLKVLGNQFIVLAFAVVIVGYYLLFHDVNTCMINCLVRSTEYYLSALI